MISASVAEAAVELEIFLLLLPDFAFSAPLEFTKTGLLMGEELVRAATFLTFRPLLLMGVVGEGLDTTFFFTFLTLLTWLPAFEGVLELGVEVRLEVEDFAEIGEILPEDETGDVLPDEDGLLGFLAEETDVTDVLFGTSGGESGGRVLGGGGGGGEVEFDTDDVSNCDFKLWTFLLLAKSLPGLLKLVFAPDPGLCAFCSKIEIRSLMPFLIPALIFAIKLSLQFFEISKVVFNSSCSKRHDFFSEF